MGSLPFLSLGFLICKRESGQTDLPVVVRTGNGENEVNGPRRGSGGLSAGSAGSAGVPPTKVGPWNVKAVSVLQGRDGFS